MSHDPILSAQDLRLTLCGREILHIDQLAIERGETVALVGPNGAGKSSLLLTLALLQEATGGVLRFDGKTVANGNTLALRRRMAVVFQEALPLDMSVRANLMTGLRIRGLSRREAGRRAHEWLERFGINHLAQQSARSLSGGEAQRMSLARAFALQPDLLFLDEPFAALDYPTRNALLTEMGQILKDLQLSTLFVTHDYTEIPYLAQKAVVLYEGRIIRQGSVEEIFGETLFDRKRWVPWESEAPTSAPPTRR